LELSYYSAEIRAICFGRDEAAAKLGYAAARELAQILADIDAFENFQEFNTMFGHRIADEGVEKKRFLLRERLFSLVYLRSSAEPGPERGTDGLSLQIDDFSD
jgi:hypothetical protein